jgi:hypothetical protein
MKWDKVCEDCLIEMFKRVGVEVETYEDVKLFAHDHGNEWYYARSWTQAESDSFFEWMDALLKTKGMNKHDRKNDIAWFDLMWGWKVEG